MHESDDALATRLRPLIREVIGCDVTRTEWLAGGLGTRRFLRVWLAPGGGDHDAPATLIARLDAPEDPARRPAGVSPEPPLEPLRAHLERSGLPVPRHYGSGCGPGSVGTIELLEDLGTTALDEVARRASAEDAVSLYREACGLVPRLQSVPPAKGVAAFERRLDAALFEYKAERFSRWTVEAELGPSPARARVVRDAFAWIAREIATAATRLAHRDLQSTNLLVTDTADRRLVMIDLQGALLAPPEYDLVCLLRDSYVELPEPFVAARCEETRPRLPDSPDREAFERRFDLLTLTRKGKDHALFRYAAEELGDRKYLAFQPATLRYLRRAASRAAARDPQLEALAEIIHELGEST
jgi:aminoglycoside/choline kinase family phosphotransferase